MLNKRPKHEKLPDYGVRFVGYGADIIARKGNATYAKLDFVTQSVLVFAVGGFVSVQKRLALSSVVADLPLCIEELKLLMKTDEPSDNDFVKLERGLAIICIGRTADAGRFVRQITQRYREIGPILDQAEKIGSGIDRPPYADYIEEIRKTGNCRVVFYGNAFFIDGKLVYRPERRTIIAKRSAENPREFVITPV
jgi:hypothetical protein